MTSNREATDSFIKAKFAEFYRGESERIEAPTAIEKREFGFLLFREKVMLRHKGFRDVEELRAFLRRIVPSHAYYSAAYYEMPEESMESKGWIGADLYFDIDADHIPTECKKVHDRWRCVKCGFSGRGTPPEVCPICGERSFDEKTWPCEVCLESAKRETVKLIDILTDDFGFSLNEVGVSFSGHRGYHIHLESEAIRELDSTSRKEMVDYITGRGIDAKFHGLEEFRGGGGTILTGPNLDETGWRGRISRGVYEFLLKAAEDDLRDIGLRRSVINLITANRDAILESWKAGGPWGLIKGVGVESWRAIIKRSVEMQSVKVDTVVTTDIHRLIRLPNTLHGKTGLMKVPLLTGEIENFDPLKEAVAFRKGVVTIYIEEAPKFRIGEETFGPFKDEKAELPTAAALLLLCKGLAVVAE